MQNGNFEAQWNGSHRCLVFPVGKQAYETDVGNVFTPPGWLFWFRHQPGTWDQPEARDAWANNDARRVKSGQKGFMYFTFYRKHDAGLLQQVQVGKGKRVKLTAWAHGWSNHLGKEQGGKPDDPKWSDGAGYRVIAWPEDLAYRPTGNPQEDARQNLAFVVGIDPTGGTDPLASTVIWGQGYCIYNGYCQQLSVEVTSAAEVVTVFLRSKTLWPFKHNDAYWDDAALEVESVGRGQPRDQYDRTYVLLPPDASLDEARATLEQHYAARRTVGFSADDAGIGDLEKRRVLAIRPEAWPGDLEGFFRHYYPGVEYQPVSSRFKLLYPTTHLPPVITGRFNDDRGTYIHKGLDLRSSWKQWGDEVICALGGEVLCAGHDVKEPSFGVQIKTLTKLGNGDLILVRYAHLVEGGCYVKAGDYVVAGQKLGRPDSTGVSSADHLHVDVRRNGVYVDPEPLIEPPTGNPQPPTPPTPPARVTAGHVGLHLQTMVDGWETFVRDLRPPVIKVLASQQDVINVKRVCPDTTVVFRHVNNDYGGIIDNPDPREGARRWIAQFRDSLYTICDRIAREFPALPKPYFYVESVNEQYCPDEAVVRRTAAFDIAFIDEVEKLGLPIRPVVFTAPVGNPEMAHYELLVPLAARCEKAGGLMGYHNYWWADPQVTGVESWWRWHAGRWAEMDRVFVASGVRVQWYGGESGAVGSEDKGPHLSAHDGWKSRICYNGNWSRYLADILWVDEQVQQWNRYNGDRFLGFVLFTSGTPSFTGWGNFQIQKAEMLALRDALLARYR